MTNEHTRNEDTAPIPGTLERRQYLGFVAQVMDRRERAQTLNAILAPMLGTDPTVDQLAQFMRWADAHAEAATEAVIDVWLPQRDAERDAALAGGRTGASASEKVLRVAAVQYLSAHADLHRTYASTAVCREGAGVIAGSALTAHCGVICPNAGAHAEANQKLEAADRALRAALGTSDGFVPNSISAAVIPGAVIEMAVAPLQKLADAYRQLVMDTAEDQALHTQLTDAADRMIASALDIARQSGNS